VRPVAIALTPPERALLVRALRELVDRTPGLADDAQGLLEMLDNAPDVGALGALAPNRTDDPVQMELDYYRGKLNEHEAADDDAAA
jgi:hypothetical protein